MMKVQGDRANGIIVPAALQKDSEKHYIVEHGVITVAPKVDISQYERVVGRVTVVNPRDPAQTKTFTRELLIPKIEVIDPDTGTPTDVVDTGSMDGEDIEITYTDENGDEVTVVIPGHSQEDGEVPQEVKRVLVYRTDIDGDFAAFDEKFYSFTLSEFIGIAEQMAIRDESAIDTAMADCELRETPVAVRTGAALSAESLTIVYLNEYEAAVQYFANAWSSGLTFGAFFLSNPFFTASASSESITFFGSDTIESATAVIDIFLLSGATAYDHRSVVLNTQSSLFLSSTAASIGTTYLSFDADRVFVDTWRTFKRFLLKYPDANTNYFGVVIDGEYWINCGSDIDISKEAIADAKRAGVFSDGFVTHSEVIHIIDHGMRAMIELSGGINRKDWPSSWNNEYTNLKYAQQKYYVASHNPWAGSLTIDILDSLSIDIGTAEAKSLVDSILSIFSNAELSSISLYYASYAHQHRESFSNNSRGSSVFLAGNAIANYESCVFHKISSMFPMKPITHFTLDFGGLGLWERYYFTTSKEFYIDPPMQSEMDSIDNADLAFSFATRMVGNGLKLKNDGPKVFSRKMYLDFYGRPMIGEVTAFNTVYGTKTKFWDWAQVGYRKTLNKSGLEVEPFDINSISYEVVDKGQTYAMEIYDGEHFKYEMLCVDANLPYEKYFLDADNPHDIDYSVLIGYEVLLNRSERIDMITTTLLDIGAFSGESIASEDDIESVSFMGVTYPLSNKKIKSYLYGYYNLLLPIINFVRRPMLIHPTASLSEPFEKTGESFFASIPNQEQMIVKMAKRIIETRMIEAGRTLYYTWDQVGGIMSLFNGEYSELDLWGTGTWDVKQVGYDSEENNWVQTSNYGAFVEYLRGVVFVFVGSFIADEVPVPDPMEIPDPAPSEDERSVEITDVQINEGIISIAYEFVGSGGLPIQPPPFVEYINVDQQGTVIAIEPLQITPAIQTPVAHDAGRYIIRSLGMGSISITPKDNSTDLVFAFGIAGSRFTINISDVINGTLPLPLRQILRDDTGFRSTYTFGLFDELQYSLPRCVETYTGTTWAQTADGVRYQQHTGYRKLVQAAADITGWKYEAAYAMNSSIGYFFIPNSIEEINISLDYWLSPIAFGITNGRGMVEKAVIVLGQTGDVAMLYCTSSDTQIASAANAISTKINAAISAFIAANGLKMADASAARAVEISLSQSMEHCTIAVRFSNGKVAVSSPFKVWRAGVDDVALNMAGATRAIRLEGLTPIEAKPVFSVGDNGQIAYGTPSKEVGSTMPQFKNSNAPANSDLAKITYGGKVVFCGAAGSGMPGMDKTNKRTVVSGLVCENNPAFISAISQKRSTSFMSGNCGNFQSEPRTQVNASITVAEGKISTPLSSFTLTTNPIIQLSNTPLVPMTEKQKWVYEHADDPIDTAGVRVSRVFSIPSRISHCNGWAVISEVYSTSGGRGGLSPSGAASSEAPVPIPNPLTCSCPDGNCIEYDYAPAIN